MTISPYLNSRRKRFFDLTLVVLSLPIVLVACLIIGLSVWWSSGWPVLFIQKRVGKQGKIFRIYKFRTMHRGADKVQDKYRKMNEADGPVFKIYNDPRYTTLGRWLAHRGLDELPQLWNVLKGEMSLVGPRPLPINEERRINEKYRNGRTLAKPGLVSEWVLAGSHRLSFEEWMILDNQYLFKVDGLMDVKIILGVLKLRKYEI